MSHICNYCAPSSYFLPWWKLEERRQKFQSLSSDETKRGVGFVSVCFVLGGIKCGCPWRKYFLARQWKTQQVLAINHSQLKIKGILWRAERERLVLLLKWGLFFLWVNDIFRAHTLLWFWFKQCGDVGKFFHRVPLLNLVVENPPKVYFRLFQWCKSWKRCWGFCFEVETTKW